MDRHTAEVLRNDVNRMIEAVKNLPDELRPRGVNWSDFMVKDICEEKSLLHGDCQIYVDVQEAAPACTSFFTSYYRNNFNSNCDIIIRCEW